MDFNESRFEALRVTDDIQAGSWIPYIAFYHRPGGYLDNLWAICGSDGVNLPVGCFYSDWVNRLFYFWYGLDRETGKSGLNHKSLPWNR